MSTTPDLAARIAALEAKLTAGKSNVSAPAKPPGAFRGDGMWLNRTTAEAHAARVSHAVQCLDGIYCPPSAVGGKS